MFYITQLIYIKEGKEDVFHQFENLAIPIIAEYNGELLLRLRPTQASVIEANLKTPYEIHLVSFRTEADFENFKLDERRKNFLHLKEESIESVLMLKGEKI